MNPALTQIIEHPEFGRIMLQAVAFAALGTNEKTVNALRKGGKLVEGEDFIRVPQKVGMARLHWTLNGLKVLAIALGTDRALAFQADINRWLNERSRGAPAASALQHQPQGDAVPLRRLEADAADEPLELATREQSPPLAAMPPQTRQRDGFSLEELQAMRAIAQSERDGQMLALLDKAITALAANQPPQSAPLAERVVYVQPQKTTHINVLWHWNGGNNNHSQGAMEAFFGLLLVMTLLSGLWVVALVSAQRTQPVDLHSTGRSLNAE